MAIIGNLLLAISTLVIIGLNTGKLAKAPPGGDAAVGYGWSLIILNLIFIGLMILVTLIIGFKGGFEWVSTKKSSRFLIVTIVLLTALATSALSSFFRHEAGPVPALLRIYSSFAPILIPSIMIIAGFILLNTPIRNSVPLALYKWPLMIVAFLGVTGSISAIIGFINESARNQAAIRKDNQDFVDNNHLRILADIDSNDVMKNLVFILVFTGDNQPDDIRNKAVAKVKSNPNWEQELIRLLQTDWAPEPLQFLSSNDVDHPELFLEPVRIGIENQARIMRETIRRSSHPSHFYQGQFMWEIDRVLRTVDRFKGKGVDYLPAVKEVRAAFDERSPYDKPNWNSRQVVDKWLKENG